MKKFDQTIEVSYIGPYDQERLLDWQCKRAVRVQAIEVLVKGVEMSEPRRLNNPYGNSFIWVSIQPFYIKHQIDLPKFKWGKAQLKNLNT